MLKTHVFQGNAPPNADQMPTMARFGDVAGGLLAGVGGDGSVGAVAECSRGTHSGPRCPDWEQGMGAAMSWGPGGRGGKPRDSLQCAGCSLGEVMVSFRPVAAAQIFWGNVSNASVAAVYHETFSCWSCHLRNL